MTDAPRTMPRLFDLVPAVYQDRDRAEGGALEAYLDVIDGEVLRLQQALHGGYANWFIETCPEWLVPYVAQLVAVRELDATTSATSRRRVLVANTVRYRRRKGTVEALTDASADTLGNTVRVVEGVARAACALHLGQPDLTAPGTLDLRSVDVAARLRTPFSGAAQGVDLRAVGARVASGDRVGSVAALPFSETLYAWLAQPYPVLGGEAKPVGGGWTFDAAGGDTRLFVPPRPGLEVAPTAGPREYGGPIPVLLAALELKRRRRKLPPRTDYFGRQPVVRVFYSEESSDLWTGPAWREVPPRDLAIADLSDPSHPIAPPLSVPEPDPDDPVGPPTAWVDLVLGRVCFEGVTPQRVLVDYAYGGTADIGAGPYPRPDLVADPDTWVFALGRSLSGSTQGGDLAAAMSALDAALAADPTATTFIVRFTDSGTYPLPAGSPGTPGSPLDLRGRRVVLAADPDQRPLLEGSLSATSSIRGAALSVEGLFLAGGVEVTDDLRTEVRQSTLAPGAAGIADPRGGGPPLSLSVVSGAGGGSVTVADSIVGGVRVAGSGRAAHLTTCIVDGALEVTSAVPVTLTRCTHFGAVRVEVLEAATDDLFVEPVVVSRRDVGAVRHSWVPEGSRTPVRFRCAPGATEHGAPRFLSTRFGSSVFGVPSPASPASLFGASSSGGVVGALPDPPTIQAQRLARTTDEYVLYGFESQLVFLT